ncbi:alpha/beta hydrolase [Microbispora rosea]|uniref:alpha/beta hydrolase n=1 Tax=Microbispora rosea TaxID=58117 RepID=UPI003D94C497
MSCWPACPSCRSSTRKCSRTCAGSRRHPSTPSSPTGRPTGARPPAPPWSTTATRACSGSPNTPRSLPATYIDTGSAEVFRDEDADYATRIWAAGGQAELHVWAGGFHGSDALYPQARISAIARRTRTEWLARVLRADRPAEES